MSALPAISQRTAASIKSAFVHLPRPVAPQPALSPVDTFTMVPAPAPSMVTTAPLAQPLAKGVSIGAFPSFQKAMTRPRSLPQTTESDLATQAKEGMSVVGGALRGSIGLPLKPIPGFERPFYQAMETAAIESMIVDTGATCVGAYTMYTGGGITVGTAGAGAAVGVPALAAGAALAGAGAVGLKLHGELLLEARKNMPLESRTYKDSRGLPSEQKGAFRWDSDNHVMHGEMPKDLPIEKMTRTELEDLAGDLRKSIETRGHKNIELGYHESHARRQAAEEHLLERIERAIAARGAE